MAFAGQSICASFSTHVRSVFRLFSKALVNTEVVATRLCLYAITGVVEVDSPFVPGKEAARHPKFDVLPSTSQPISMSEPVMQLFNARGQRRTGAFRQEDVVQANTIWVEPAEDLFLFVGHSEIWRADPSEPNALPCECSAVPREWSPDANERDAS